MDHSNIHQSNTISSLGDDERKKNFPYLAMFEGMMFKGVVLVLLLLILYRVRELKMEQILMQNYQATHNHSVCDCNRQEINREFQSWDKGTKFVLDQELVDVTYHRAFWNKGTEFVLDQELVDAIYQTTNTWYLQLLIKSSINHLQVAPAFLSIHHDEENRMVFSKPFFAFKEGHLMCMSVFLNGYGDSEGKHVSVFLHLMKGPHDDKLEESGHFPLKGTFTVELLNPLSNRDHHSKIYLINNETCLECGNRVRERRMGKGYADGFNFISQKNLQYYYKDNNLYFQIHYDASHVPAHFLKFSLLLFVVFVVICILDDMFIFIMLIIIELYRGFKETSTLILAVLSIFVDYPLIGQFVKKNTNRKIFTIGVIVVADNLMITVWEYTDLLSYNSVTIIRNAITRILIVSVFYEVVNIFSLYRENAKFIIISPLLLSIILIITCKITLVMTVIIFFATMFCNMSIYIINDCNVTIIRYLNL